MSTPYQHPPCIQCGGEVIKRADEKPNKWRSRQTCSQECYKTLCHRVRYQHPPCKYCGNPVIRRQSDKFNQFKQRLHCSVICARRSQARMKQGGSRPAAVREPKTLRVKQELRLDFSAHNLAFTRDVRRLLGPDLLIRSSSSSSASWAYAGGRDRSAQ